MKIESYSFAGLRLASCETIGPVSLRSEARVSLGNCMLSGDIEIGFGTYMNGGMIRSRVVIGRFCSIGRSVSIGLGNHDMSHFSTSSFFSFKNSLGGSSKTFPDRLNNKRVVIENDVWIGDGVYVLSGVRICSGSCIGAGSIVTKDIEPYTINVGSPARPIKYRFDDSVRHELLHLNWWDKDPELLATITSGSPEALLKDERLANSASIPPAHVLHRF